MRKQNAFCVYDKVPRYNCEVVLAYDDMLAELLGAVREREAENDEG